MFKVRMALSLLLQLLVVTLLAGCATPSRAPLTGLVPGREVETLTSPISLSLKTAERSLGGRGFLIFKHPGRFHLAILSPFGTTLADIYSDGQQFSSVIPSRQVAFRGPVAHLPERDGLKAWALMQWVMERTPPAGPALERSNVNAAGVRETLYYDPRGFLERKETEEGNRVIYRDYRNVDGVAFPGSIELIDSRNNLVKVIFEEPEINREVGEAALTPMLEGLRVLPFSEFRGF